MGGAAAYFGTAVPHSLSAKAAFGCDVSGCASPAGLLRLLSEHLGPAAATPLLLLGGLGAMLASLARPTRSLLFSWAVLHLAAFTFGRAPDSPWYYAPLVPVLLAGCGAAIVFAAGRRPPGRLVAIVMISLAASLAGLQIARMAHRDPLGAHTRWNATLRELAGAVTADMASRGLPRAHVLAYEVGYLGWVVPGRVDDLLGIVSPGLQPCLAGEDPAVVLERLRPDYVLVGDQPGYAATGCLHTTAGLRRDFETIATVPRPWGTYLVLRRRQSAPAAARSAAAQRSIIQR
jgi:hypothetical protein